MNGRNDEMEWIAHVVFCDGKKMLRQQCAKGEGPLSRHLPPENAASGTNGRFDGPQRGVPHD
jgi:hypothetical protein